MRWLGYAWNIAAVWFLLSAFVFPVLWVRWRAREKRDAAKTDRTLRLLKADTTHAHEMDAI
jgi:membrane protein implicated in regulation of membrane protease activity